ncbi:MAG: YfhO family protein [Verrucomicrobiales bacterium]|jgi:hypothetical protein|nr:YfhO family protein [Verrucomicrobiales bacterium]
MKRKAQNANHKTTTQKPKFGTVGWRKFTGWRGAAALILFALTLIFFADVLTGTKVFLLRDSVFDFINWKMAWADTVWRDGFPFWDQVGTGKPCLGDAWNAVLYPANLLYLALPVWTALNWQNLLHVFLTGLAAHKLLRQFGLCRAATLTAAVGVMFSTWLVAYMEFTVIIVAPWLLFTLAALARLARADADGGGTLAASLAAALRRRALLAGLAVAFALGFLAHYFEFYAYNFVAGGLLIVSVAVCRRDWRPALTLTLCTGLAGLLAMLLVLPDLGPVLQFLPESSRSAGGTLDNRFWMASLTPAHLLTAVFPFLGGRPGFPDTYWAAGAYEFWVGTYYTGALTVLAAPFAWLAARADDGKKFRLPVWWGVALLVTGALLAAGENTPVYPWIWRHVPVMDKFRFAAKFLLLVVFGLTTLSAVGLHYALTVSRRAAGERRRVRNWLIAESALVVLLGALAFFIWCDPALMPALFGGEANIRPAQLDAALPLLGWSWLFLALACGWLWLATARPARWVTVSGVALVFCNLLVLSRAILPTAPSAPLAKKPAAAEKFGDGRFRIHSDYVHAQQYFYGDDRADLFAWGREAGVGSSWNAWRGTLMFYQNGGQLQKFNRLRALALGGNAPVANNLLDAAGVRWAVGGAPWQQILWGGARRDLTLTERPSALPRFALYPDWQAVADDDAALRYLTAAPNERLRRCPAVEPAALFDGRATRAALPPSPSATNPAPGTLTVTAEHNHRLALTVSAAAPRLLIVSDSWYPGWRAFIDGQETPLHRANYLFRGVFVPAGEHTINFTYWPNHFAWYLAAAALGLLIVSGLLLGGLAKNSRREDTKARRF